MNSPNRSAIFAALLVGLAVVIVGSANADHARAEPLRPNVIIFLVDDMGWGDLACYGHPVMKTPNLDRFASEGLLLTNCYAACSVCSPSRSAILTGRTPYRNGVWRWIPAESPYHLRSSEISIATLLQQKGYATCHVGKWHLNGKFNSDEQPQPDDHGFDWWLATQNNAAPSHKNPNNFVRNRQPVGALEGFSAVLIVEEAIAWLNDHRDPEKPFFLTVWTHEPHLPIESDPRFQALYEGDEGLRQHHGNVTQIDFAFGKLMRHLSDAGLAGETLVVFTSDNGPEGSGNDGRTRGSTGGLRGRKRSSFEGGIRVPGLIRWPGHVPPGSRSDEPVIGSDLFTTICDIAGIPLPDDRTIDGASILPIFRGEGVQRTQPLYWRNHLADNRHKVALRDGPWKILGSNDLTHFELYNLVDDPQESRELSAAHPEQFERMKQWLIAHDRAVLQDGPDWWRREEKP